MPSGVVVDFRYAVDEAGRGLRGRRQCISFGLRYTSADTLYVVGHCHEGLMFTYPDSSATDEGLSPKDVIGFLTINEDGVPNLLANSSLKRVKLFMCHS